jgi:hypothetical protein
MNTPTTYLGLDIAKLTLDLSPHPTLTCQHYANDPRGHARLPILPPMGGRPPGALPTSTKTARIRIRAVNPTPNPD